MATPQINLGARRTALLSELDEHRTRFQSATYEALLDPASQSLVEELRKAITGIEQQIADLALAEREAAVRAAETAAERDRTMRAAAFVAGAAHMDQAIEHAAALSEAIMTVRNHVVAFRQATDAMQRAMATGGPIDAAAWRRFSERQLLSWMEIEMALQPLKDEWSAGKPHVFRGRRVAEEFLPNVRERANRSRSDAADMLGVPRATADGEES